MSVQEQEVPVYDPSGQYLIGLRSGIVDLMFDNMPGIVSLYEVIRDEHGQIMNYQVAGCNRTALQLGGFPEVVGHYITDINPTEDVLVMMDNYEKAIQAGHPIQEEVNVSAADGTPFWLDAHTIPIYGDDGIATHILTVANDITAQKMKEFEQNRLLEEQERTLAELSTPLLTIADNTVVLPLIGVLDSRRVEIMNNNLLAGVQFSGANQVIIDITGVPVVDTQVANALIQAAQAVRLLGATAIISGIRPEVAQTLVGLGVDLSKIPTMGTLQSAITYSLRGRF